MIKDTLIVISGSSEQGGAENQLCNLLERFDQFEIVLIFFSSNLNLGTFKKLKLNKKIVILPITLSKPKFFLENIKNVLSIISNSKKKVKILCWLAKGNLLGIFLGLIRFNKTKIFCSHRSYFNLNQSLKSRFLLFISLFIYRIYPKKITHIINSREIISSPIISFFLRSKPIYIANSFSYKKIFKSSETNKKKYKYLNLLVVARFSKEKGYKFLFKALNKTVVPFKIKCIGKGCTYKNKDFKELCEKYKIFPIAIEKSKNLRKEYRTCDFLIQSSYSESFPNVVVESILEGTLVISTPTGPFINILKKYNLLTSNYDFVEHAKTINNAYKLKENPLKYKKISQDLRAEIQSMINTPDECIKAYEKVLLDI